VKAAAKPTAQAAAKAKSVAVSKATAGKSTPAKASPKPAAKAVKKAVPPPAAKTKAAAKPETKASAKPAKPAVSPPAAKKPVAKAAPKTAAPAKTAAKAVTKPAPPVAKAVPAKAPAAKTKTTAQVAVKPVAKTSAPAAPVPGKAAATGAAGRDTPGSVRPGQEVAVLAVGKRAAKKAMMAQMAQAISVPTHDPDAAKATFSFSNERAMNTPVHTPVRKDPKLANNWKAKPVDQLSDDEVLSMPDSEYMNDVQLAFFRLKLSNLKADMLANAGETTEHLREDTVVVPDPADRATIEEEHALELRTRDRERKLLKKIEQAITRIDAGDYGYCDETGEAIGVGRLLARPTASLSLEAQQRRELKQKMFGD